MTLATGVRLPKAEIGEICRRYRVKELSVFGSAARGELRPDSDIDLLSGLPPGRETGIIGSVGYGPRVVRAGRPPRRPRR